MAEQNITSSSNLADQDNLYPFGYPSRSTEPTTKDACFLLQVVLNQPDKLKTDWKAVAEAMGLKNASTASTRFYQIKKKLIAKSEPTASSTNTSALGAAFTGIKRQAPLDDKAVGTDDHIVKNKKRNVKVKREKKPASKTKQKKQLATQSSTKPGSFGAADILAFEAEEALFSYNGPIFP